MEKRYNEMNETLIKEIPLGQYVRKVERLKQKDTTPKLHPIYSATIDRVIENLQNGKYKIEDVRTLDMSIENISRLKRIHTRYNHIYDQSTTSS